MVPEAEQFPKHSFPFTPFPGQSSDSSAGLALCGLFIRSHPPPFSYLGFLKGRDPQSTRPCITTTQKLAETTLLPSVAQPGHRQYLVGRAGPGISGHCFCCRAAPLFRPAWPHKTLVPPVPLHSAGAVLPAAQPPQLPGAARSRPRRARLRHCFGVGEAEGAGEEGRQGGGRKRLLLSEKY